MTQFPLLLRICPKEIIQEKQFCEYTNKNIIYTHQKKKLMITQFINTKCTISSSVKEKNHWGETKRVRERGKDFMNFYAIILQYGKCVHTQVRKRSCEHKNSCFKVMEI